MTTCIPFFCASLFACCALLASPSVELQFLPNEIADITTSTQYTKEIAFQGTLNKFSGRQEIRMDLALDDEIGKFPFHVTLILHDIQFSNSKNDKSVELSAIEKAEARSLLKRPLQFVLKERSQPIEMEEDQKKLFGDYSLLTPKKLVSILDEDIQDLFLLAETPLKEGETFSFPKKIGSIEMPIDYTIKEITPNTITVALSGKLDRVKVALKKAMAVATGEIQGEILWDRKNSIYFTSHQKGQLQYKFKLNEQEASIQLEFNKDVVSRPKVDE